MNNIAALACIALSLEKRANAMDDYIRNTKAQLRAADTGWPWANVTARALSGAGLGAGVGLAKGLYDNYTEKDPRKKPSRLAMLRDILLGGGVGAVAGTAYGINDTANRMINPFIGRNPTLVEKLQLLNGTEHLNPAIEARTEQIAREVGPAGLISSGLRQFIPTSD